MSVVSKFAPDHRILSFTAFSLSNNNFKPLGESAKHEHVNGFNRMVMKVCRSTAFFVLLLPVVTSVEPIGRFEDRWGGRCSPKITL
jgi:hypothetical protein